MANRQNFPRNVEREIARRAVNAIGEKCCENCGAVGVPLELHHLRMDAMQTAEAKRRKLTAADGAMWCEDCHNPETARQRKELAKVEKAEAAYWLPRRPKMQGRPFPRVERERREVTKRCEGQTAFARQIVTER